MTNSLCGIDCTKCELNSTCNGCAKTLGKPFGSECIVALSLKGGEISFTRRTVTDVMELSLTKNIS